MHLGRQRRDLPARGRELLLHDAKPLLGLGGVGARRGGGGELGTQLLDEGGQALLHVAQARRARVHPPAQLGVHRDARRLRLPLRGGRGMLQEAELLVDGPPPIAPAVLGGALAGLPPGEALERAGVLLKRLRPPLHRRRLERRVRRFGAISIWALSFSSTEEMNPLVA